MQKNWKKNLPSPVKHDWQLARQNKQYKLVVQLVPYKSAVKQKYG